MAVTAQFEFDSREYYRALRDTSRQHASRWLIPIFGIVLPAVMIWVGVGQHRHEMTTVEAFWNALPWLLLGGFYLTLTPMIHRATARKALENDPGLRGPQSRTVDNDGLHVRGAGFSQDLKWSDLVRVVETADFFLFFYNKRVAHYLPKRVLDDSAVEGVRRLARARLPGKAIVRNRPAVRA